MFDNPAGQYLRYFDTAQGKYLPFRWESTQTAEDVPNGYVLLGNHITAIQGALGLTANDVESILIDNGSDIASAPLTLDNVSLLYRYALLSQGLQLSVEDFIALKQLSVDLINTPPLNVVNRFDPLLTTPIGALKDDRPWGGDASILRPGRKTAGERVFGSGSPVHSVPANYRSCRPLPAGPCRAGGTDQISGRCDSCHSKPDRGAVRSYDIYR
jgi:hypothetical protein